MHLTSLAPLVLSFKSLYIILVDKTLYLLEEDRQELLGLTPERELFSGGLGFNNELCLLLHLPLLGPKKIY